MLWKYEEQGGSPQDLKNYMSMEQFPLIQGHDFGKPFKLEEFMDSFLHMGFQGSHFGMAVQIFKEVLEKKQKGELQFYMSFTGNMISSGNRELITYLVKNNLVDGISTTAAAIEEDIMKCIKPFHLGNFEVQGRFLLDECVGRIGNIFVPADRYLYLERFLNVLFPRILAKQKESKPLAPHEITRIIGEQIETDERTKDKCEQSFLYWAAKNNIPVFCPTITDGAIGDISTFFKRKHPEFAIDVTGDNAALSKALMNAGETASLTLGGGSSKHFLLNSCIFREGFEYAIYMTTATEHDGSDSGGNQEEAISWGKIKPDAKRVKVVADATIVFPFLMASAFGTKQ